MSLNFYCEDEENNREEESINKYKDLFINYESNLPTLEEALTQMFKSEGLKDEKVSKFTEDILNKSKEHVDSNFNEIKNKYNYITKEDAYIICSYTCECEDKKYSPYRILNQNLISDDRRNGVRNISKYLYILLKSLRKLPRYYPKNGHLYRCLTCKVSLSQDPNNNKHVPYIVGNKKTFWGFTSTSPDPDETFKFLSKNAKANEGTIFTLGGDIWGYDIEIFNYFKEKEFLLEPERKFKVDDAIPPINGIIHVTCTIFKTPLILNNNEENNKINSFDSSINGNLIQFQMEAKINEKNEFTSGIGILCNISYKNIKALITYNHLINIDFLNQGKKINLHINNEEKEIDMKINRYKFTDKDLDITVIEILERDNIYNFIELDKYINSRNFVDDDIISVSLRDKKNIELSFGKIKEKNNDTYICTIKSIKEGIILLKENYKLIGIIKENKNKNEIEFISMSVILNKINFIKCKYEIKKEDLGKDIQIISGKDFFGKLKNEEIAKEMKTIIDGEINSNILEYKFNKEGIYIIYFLSYNFLTNMSYMFCKCISLKELNLSSFNSNLVNNMSCMFNNCSLLKELDLSAVNTDKVINMSGMFGSCTSLKRLNLSSFNTKKVTDMSYMFNGCSSLEELNLSSFNTPQITNIYWMFRDCSSLKELNLSSLNTDKITNMSCLFDNCSSLEELNLSSFNTSKVTNMSCMFGNCSSLKKLNLSSFNTNKVNKMSFMFDNCSSLEELNLSSFNTNQETDLKDMFNSINKSCKIECKDEKILNEFKDETGCIII